MGIALLASEEGGLITSFSPRAAFAASLLALLSTSGEASEALLRFQAKDVLSLHEERGQMPRQVPEAQHKSSKLTLYAVKRWEKIGSEVYSCIVYLDSTVRCSSGERSYETRVRPN